MELTRGALVVIAGLATAAMSSAWGATEARPATEARTLLYAFRFDGLRVGDVVVNLELSDADYRSALYGWARGLLRVFGDFRTELEGRGSRGNDSTQLQPRAFQRVWSSGHRGAAMTVTFDAASRLATSEERTFNVITGADIPSRGRPRQPLPPAKRTDVLDPLTGFVAARDLIRARWSGGPSAEAVRLAIFDGRHRYDAVFAWEATATESINGRVEQVVPVTVRIEPAGGFEPGMAAHTREGTGRVLFSADERFLPLRVSVGNTLGRGTFTLIGDCDADPAPCTRLIEEHRVPAPQ